MSTWMPYSPPVVSGRPVSVAGDSRSAAVRASLLMIVIGVVLLGLGGMTYILASALTSGPVPAELRVQVQQLEQKVHLPFLSIVKGVYLALFVTAAVLGGLGVWVRSGRRSAAITAMVAVSLLLLFVVLQIVSTMLMIAGGGPAPQLLAGLSIWVICLAVGGLLMSWLWQVSRLPRRQPMPVATPSLLPEIGSAGVGYRSSPPPPPLTRNPDR